MQESVARQEEAHAAELSATANSADLKVQRVMETADADSEAARYGSSIWLHEGINHLILLLAGWCHHDLLSFSILCLITFYSHHLCLAVLNWTACR